MQPTESVADVGEFRVNYASAGKGESVLLLHASDRREDWHVWEPMIPLFDGYSLLMPDMVGFGKSSVPEETPDYVVQARVMKDLLDRLSVKRVNLIGMGWGGQVALELALNWPDAVRSIVLLASTYSREQVGRLKNLRKPTLIMYAEDDMVTPLKAGYLLRDAIRTSRLEVMDPVARESRHGLSTSHRLERFRAPLVLQMVRLFLSKPEAMVAEPPEMENELRGLALKEEGSEVTSRP